MGLTPVKKSESLRHLLLRMKAELLIRKRKIETKMFKREVVLSNIIFAISEALKQIEKGKE